jgi:hypothetical protein
MQDILRHGRLQSFEANLTCPGLALRQQIVHPRISDTSLQNPKHFEGSLTIHGHWRIATSPLP